VRLAAFFACWAIAVILGVGVLDLLAVRILRRHPSRRTNR
jgi:hypothetical protein